MSSELLKFNKQEKVTQGRFICQGCLFPHYKDEYIINMGIVVHFELPSRQRGTDRTGRRREKDERRSKQKCGET